MKELVKPTKLEKQWQSTELYGECSYTNFCWEANFKSYDYNFCYYNVETGADVIIF